MNQSRMRSRWYHCKRVCDVCGDGWAMPGSAGFLILAPDNEPPWVRLYVHPIGDRRAAMRLADETQVPIRGGSPSSGTIPRPS